MLAGGRVEESEFECPSVSEECKEILECALADDSENFGDVVGHRRDDLGPVSFPVFNGAVMLFKLRAKGDRDALDVFEVIQVGRGGSWEVRFEESDVGDHGVGITRERCVWIGGFPSGGWGGRLVGERDRLSGCGGVGVVWLVRRFSLVWWWVCCRRRFVVS